MARTSTTRDNAPTGADAHPSGVERQHLPVGSFVAGTYRIEGLLGEGGGGVVYRAVHVELGRAFAVKVLRAGAEPDAAWRFVQEAKIASSLAHPNIVDVVHLGRDDDGRHFVVMELLAGEDLQGRLARAAGSGLPFDEAQSVFEAVLDGVGAAHDAGVVHRDLKPANIFLAEKRGSREVKVLDFGMSRTLAGDVHVTRTGELVGTPLYMAPEQSKEAGVDARADVYSLGVVAYEMLSGRVPFPAETLYACVLSHALQPPPPLEELRPEVPAAVVQVVHRCLAKEPSGRFADARALRRAWSDAWASGSVDGLPASATTTREHAVAPVAPAHVAVQQAAMVQAEVPPTPAGRLRPVSRRTLLSLRSRRWRGGRIVRCARVARRCLTLGTHRRRSGHCVACGGGHDACARSSPAAWPNHVRATGSARADARAASDPPLCAARRHRHGQQRRRPRGHPARAPARAAPFASGAAPGRVRQQRRRST
jgi:serine/threonine protein kinase